MLVNFESYEGSLDTLEADLEVQGLIGPNFTFFHDFAEETQTTLDYCGTLYFCGGFSSLIFIQVTISNRANTNRPYGRSWYTECMYGHVRMVIPGKLPTRGDVFLKATPPNGE